MLNDKNSEAPICYCEYCGGEIYKGNEYYMCDEEVFCDMDCVCEYLKELHPVTLMADGEPI